MCIAWSQNWAGDIGNTIAFHARELTPNRFVVGYFVYWSTERPWGQNGVTRQLIPALAIDAFYSHLMFVLPGIQRVLYGPGDIEGFRVVYELDRTGMPKPISVFADDGYHHEHELAPLEAVDERSRVILLVDVWSHQLGGRAATTALRSGSEHRCYEGDGLQPLTSEVAAAFRLGDSATPRRARPAWRLHASPTAR